MMNGLKHTRPPANVRRCDNCGAAMEPAAVLPRFGMHPELRSYRCPLCGNMAVDSMDDDDADISVVPRKEPR
jgi:predicted RNA-binding Zn-ribbon protein involved in translation (DUF1610 family)